MMEITITSDVLGTLHAALLTRQDVECCAVLYASQVRRSDGLVRLLVADIDIPDTSDYLTQAESQVVLKPEFVARVTKKSLRRGLSIVFAHSHLGEEPPDFSWVDDKGEEHLARFLGWRLPNRSHGALVMSAGGIAARELGKRDRATVIEVGDRRVIHSEPRTEIQDDSAGQSQFDRQIRAFGIDGQRLIQGIRAGIVGLGGTGSIVAQQLAHLGVQRFVLIDPDTVEESNLNRIVGATAGDIGRPKVEVASDAIRRIRPDACIQVVQGDVVREKFARELVEADFLFGCTDSHGSRALLQQIAYQYLIPCIDMGSTITTAKGRVTGIFGRVQYLAPGYGCFTCSGLLDSEQVRRDMMSTSERSLDPYIVGQRVPAPSVISLNGTVASLAITMFMAIVAGVPGEGRHVIYNAIRSTVRVAKVQSSDGCFICSPSGVLSRGDLQQLFARRD